MDHNHEDPFCLECALLEIVPLLPLRGPIRDFVAQNTLQAFIDLPFDEAIDQGSKLYGAKAHMDLSFYRDKFSKAQISKKSLDLALTHYFPGLSSEEQELLEKALHEFLPIDDQKTFDFLVRSKEIDPQQIKAVLDHAFHLHPPLKQPISIAKAIELKLSCSPDQEVNPILFRLMGSFTDQGISLWSFLDQNDGFQKVVMKLALNSYLPLAYFVDNRDFAASLKLDPEHAIKELCQKILASPSCYRQYIKETLLEHPGWSGMINAIEKKPLSLAKKVDISIKEILSVKLALAWQFIKHHDPDFMPLTADELVNQKEVTDPESLSLAWWLLQMHTRDLSQKIFGQISTVTLKRIWHYAMEEEYYEHVRRIIAQKPKPLPPTAKKYQAIFCVDERECSYRRHLEELSLDIETFGYPGFFGIDCYFQAHKKDLLEKLCPLPLTPNHLIVEKAFTPKKIAPDKRLIELAAFVSSHGANSTILGFVSAYTLGHLSLLRLMMSFFHPLKLKKTKELSDRYERTVLQFERIDEKKHHGLFLGYSLEEMADRVYTALKYMGLKQLSEMVFLIGHGSSSTNNPHFAAYDCGACSGRPGGINARLFAMMANKPEVKELVRQRGIDIPNSTVFIGGLHDTCNDDLTLFDTNALSLKQSAMLEDFLRVAGEASGNNAKERCRKFALAKPDISPTEALKEVHHRSRSLFEPRPELGHANNALCIVGRRARTYRSDFDRRAFLQSYDPTSDGDGQILSALLPYIIPVCGGINLEYFFSRIDPAIYGCGTKLSHNVCSLLGVGNGLDDDLRTGLPIQTTELHDPVRLLIIIEQSEPIIIKALKANPTLIPWVKNGWIRLASLDPDSQSLGFLK